MSAAEIVTVDIGGTHARFALARVADGRVVTLGDALVLRTADHAGFASAWAAFGRQLGAPLPRAAAIAVAAVIDAEATALTNNPWVIRPAELGAALGVDRQLLVNDFEAVAHAVAQAAPEEFVHLCGPDTPLPATGTISIIGPGTGLGVAHVRRGGGQYHVQATEGGHIGFAPLDPVDDAILARLRQRHARVSAERIVAGPGLAEICATLAATAGRPPPALDDTALWTLALAGSDPIASAAVERFCAIFGGVAGDIALAQGAAAVVIAGGLGLRLGDRLRASGFAARFCAKGRREALMAALPVRLITHPQPGLFGAAAAFARKFSQ